MNRKDWLKLLPASLLPLAMGAAPEPMRGTAKRVLRIAHLTDTHLMPDRDAERGMRACLAHCQSLSDAPDLIALGGDVIHDALSHPLEQIEAQWEVWRRVKSDIRLPLLPCIGNHDVHPPTGKLWAMRELGMESPYYDLSMNGWHLIVLDSTMLTSPAGRYTAKLDDEQFAWLEARLKAIDASTPILIQSHIPILCAAAYLDGDNESTGNWVVPGAWMHIDARRITDLFHKHPNVKACISGHIHLLDSVVYNGVTYHCDGAVCGAWWKGAYKETGPGYALIDLYDDGSSHREYVDFGWV